MFYKVTSIVNGDQGFLGQDVRPGRHIWGPAVPRILLQGDVPLAGQVAVRGRLEHKT